MSVIPSCFATQGWGSYFWKGTQLQLHLRLGEELENFSYFSYSYYYRDLAEEVTEFQLQFPKS